MYYIRLILFAFTFDEVKNKEEAGAVKEVFAAKDVTEETDGEGSVSYALAVGKAQRQHRRRRVASVPVCRISHVLMF